jgi:hypothetical protein
VCACIDVGESWVRQGLFWRSGLGLNYGYGKETSEE